jgi:hypothetical protein
MIERINPINGLSIIFKIVFYLFLEETSLIYRFKNQMLSFVIETVGTQDTLVKIDTLIFIHILNMFTNLQYLNFNPYFFCNQRISFCSSLPPIFSSTLLELHIKVMYIEDCLYLLDGRFNQLRTLYVYISIFMFLFDLKNK